jgi:hypothetical protein
MVPASAWDADPALTRTQAPSIRRLVMPMACDRWAVATSGPVSGRRAEAGGR